MANKITGLKRNVTAMKETNAGADTLEGPNIHVYKSVKIKRACRNTDGSSGVYDCEDGTKY